MASSYFSFSVTEWTAELIQGAPQYADALEKYETIPDLFIAKTSEDRADTIRHLPGIRSMAPTTEGVRRVVFSIDHQVMIAAVHRRTIKPNGIDKAAEVVNAAGVPKLPVLNVIDSQPQWTFDDVVVLPTRLCMTGALNLSLEPIQRIAFDPDDPVCLAIESAAAQLPVVIAAGNFKPGQSDRTMYGWTQCPSVISVGATEPDGSAVASFSRIGDPGRSIAGPSLVANGTDESGDTGTSFAAPVVSRQLAYLTAALMLVRTVAQQEIASAETEGVPVVARCFVDLDSLPDSDGHGRRVHDFASRPRKLPCLPIAGVNRHAVRSMLRESGGERSPLLRLPPPQLLRELLILSATPVPNTTTSEAGAGLVSDATTKTFLAHIDGETLGARGRLVVNAVERGLKEPIFDEVVLGAFLDGVRDSMIGWASDIKQFGSDDPQPIFVEKPPRS